MLWRSSGEWWPAVRSGTPLMPAPAAGRLSRDRVCLRDARLATSVCEASRERPCKRQREVFDSMLAQHRSRDAEARSRRGGPCKHPLCFPHAGRRARRQGTRRPARIAGAWGEARRVSGEATGTSLDCSEARARARARARAGVMHVAGVGGRPLAHARPTSDNESHLRSDVPPWAEIHRDGDAPNFNRASARRPRACQEQSGNRVRSSRARVSAEAIRLSSMGPPVTCNIAEASPCADHTHTHTHEA